MITKEFAEFIGILLGDGFLWSKDNHYRIGITISSKNKDYQKHVLQLIKSFYSGHVMITERNRATYFLIHSKELFYFITKDLGIPFGSRKGTEGKIPKRVIDAGLENQAIKGLIDTDGTFFRSNKKGVYNYPTIEFSNTNELLVNQMDNILKKKGLKTNLRKCKGTNKKTFKLSIYGEKMLTTWLENLGQTFKIRDGNSARESARE